MATSLPEFMDVRIAAAALCASDGVCLEPPATTYVARAVRRTNVFPWAQHYPSKMQTARPFAPFDVVCPPCAQQHPGWGRTRYASLLGRAAGPSRI
jgi:hypothetical protein